jgi:hypothetical protein
MIVHRHTDVDGFVWVLLMTFYGVKNACKCCATAEG